MILINKICINSYVKRNFSKFKLIKSYRKSIMLQEILSRLTISSIKKEILEKFKYKNLISNFTFQKIRKIDFK